MHRVHRILLLTGLAIASPATSNVILHDREAEPLVTSQSSPSTAIAGGFLVTVWEQQFGSAAEFNVSVAASPLGSSSVVDVGVPPAPAGYLWYEDPLVSAPDPNAVGNGTFYLFGQIRSTGVSPFTFGLGFLRGHVQPGPSITWETPQVIETYGINAVNNRFIGVLSMDVHPGTEVVHIGYCNTNLSQNLRGLWHRISPNGGVSWNTPMRIGNDTTQFSSATIQCGPVSADVAIYWTEDPSPLTRRLYCRRSSDFGATLGPIETVRTFSSASQSAPHGVSGMAFSLATESDRRGVADPQRYVARGEERDHVGIFMPDPSATPAIVEVEPNGNWVNATDVPLNNCVVRGTLTGGAPADTDYYAFTTGPNQPIEIWADSVDASITSFACTWIGQNGHSILTRREKGTTSSAPLRLGFSSGWEGRYLLQVVRGSAGAGGYRIRTSLSTSSVGARDQRDLFVSTATGSQSWSPSVNASAFYTGPGWDEGGVSLASNRDGYLYMSFFDWSQALEGEVAARMMMRSPDGGASWLNPTIVATAYSNWYTALGTAVVPVKLGPWGDMATDGTDIHNVWVDVRNGDPDLYGVTITRSLDATGLEPPEVIAHRGDAVEVGVTTHNRDDWFGWILDIVPVPARAWPLATAHGALGPGMTTALPFGFTIPDTAALGSTELTLQVRSNLPPYTTYGSLILPITILASTGVPAGPHTLSLLPISPNPASASARVTFTLPGVGRARADVFGIDGRHIRILADEVLPEGPHVRPWDGRDDSGRLVAPGAYLIRLEAAGRTQWRRMVWLR